MTTMMMMQMRLTQMRMALIKRIEKLSPLGYSLRWSPARCPQQPPCKEAVLRRRAHSSKRSASPEQPCQFDSSPSLGTILEPAMQPTVKLLVSKK